MTWSVLVLSVSLFGFGCGGDEPDPFEQFEEVETPAAPAPTPEAPTPDVVDPPTTKAPPVKKKKKATGGTNLDRDTTKKAAGKPAMGKVSIKGDAKTVWLLGDGHDNKYENGGTVVAGAYKVKAWYKNDPVPKVATSVVVAAGDDMIITCSSKAKWCRKGALEVPSMDTGGGGD